MAWKKPLDFGGNPDHVTLGLGVLIGLGAVVGGVRDVF